jgi:hypothetical protein
MEPEIDYVTGEMVSIIQGVLVSVCGDNIHCHVSGRLNLSEVCFTYILFPLSNQLLLG